MAGPRYPHDCDECIYLGKHRAHDLYFCPCEASPMVTARYGRGADYMTGSALGPLVEPLSVAKKLAEERGLV
jgi:hypothetical protein